ncbi:MAG: PD-(D/E)XK nuclease family protein, partial [Deltaproteobacteria bacterium]|nr:PD-(D/E)XK nuclease family protein [Deltaproteobacteria bacterium]
LQGADELAAWLAVQKRREQTVIIGADAVLDGALNRHGLPTSGAAADDANVLLQLLPLVLDLAWSPPDPLRALELLTLPISPIPRGLARRLADALHTWPAVGSPPWQEALSAGLEGLDAERLAKVQPRVETLLTPTLPVNSDAPKAEVSRRVHTLIAWLEARRQAAGDSETAAWNAALAQCGLFEELLDATTLNSLTGPLLQRLAAESMAAVGKEAPYQAQAGLSFVDQPDGLLGPAPRIIWWGFSHDSVPKVHALPFTPAELTALAARGVTLPDAGKDALALAARWRRPLLQATEQLVLICPEGDNAGDVLHPHPLWDEVGARLAAGQTSTPLERRMPRSRKTPRTTTRELLPKPRARRAWKVQPASVKARQTESPSSLGRLLGCSFSWALQYTAKIRGGVSTRLATGPQLAGSVIHEILAAVLAKGVPASPEAAQAQAEETFDRLAPRLAAEYFRPGGEGARSNARFAAGRSAAELTRQLQVSNLGIAAVEEYVSRDALGSTLGGRADLVAGPPGVVIDFKRKYANAFREMLKKGTAYQLACYAYLHQKQGEGAYPDMAYFILESQQLLLTSPDTIPEAEAVSGPNAEETWLALEAGFEQVSKAVAEGERAGA